MTDSLAVLIPVGTTICVPTLYFAIFRYPDAFNEKVGSMAIFHWSYLAQIKSRHLVMSNSKNAIDVLKIAYETFESFPNANGQSKEQVVDALKVESARLRGYHGSDEFIPTFVVAAEKEIQNVIDLIVEDVLKGNEIARALQIAIYALDSAIVVQNERNAIKKNLYDVEMRLRQVSIERLSWTKSIAMSGLNIGMALLSIWIGYNLYFYGYWWRVIIPIVIMSLIVSLFLLRQIANKSIESSSSFLASLKAPNA